MLPVARIMDDENLSGKSVFSLTIYCTVSSKTTPGTAFKNVSLYCQFQTPFLKSGNVRTSGLHS